VTEKTEEKEELVSKAESLRDDIQEAKAEVRELEDTISENELEVKTLRAKKDEIQSEVESVGAERDVLEDLLSTATDLNTKETQLQAAKTGCRTTRNDGWVAGK